MAYMHQIQFRLGSGLCPGPLLRELTVLPGPPSWIKVWFKLCNCKPKFSLPGPPRPGSLQGPASHGPRRPVHEWPPVKSAPAAPSPPELLSTVVELITSPCREFHFRNTNPQTCRRSVAADRYERCSYRGSDQLVRTPIITARQRMTRERGGERENLFAKIINNDVTQ